MNYFRNLIVLLALTASAYNVKAQDTLYFHRGDICVGKVVEVTEASVKFIYENETMSNEIGVNALEKVKFQSGREQQLSTKIVVNSPSDWKNVRVVQDKEHVKGLRFVKNVEKHSSGAWSFAITAGHFSEKTLKKLRQEAAKNGCVMVLILSQQSRSQGFFKTANASMTAEIYAY